MADTKFTEELYNRDDHPLTVGDLRKAIEGVPDDMPIRVDTTRMHWYMDRLKTVSPMCRVRPQAIEFSHTGKLIIEL